MPLLVFSPTENRCALVVGENTNDGMKFDELYPYKLKVIISFFWDRH